MSNVRTLVREALKNLQPTLFKQLSAAGTLDEFVATRADEINEAIVSRTMQIAQQQGLTETTSPLDKAAMLKVAESLASEEVLSEMLEFPPDETSPQKPDETTPLAMAI